MSPQNVFGFFVLISLGLAVGPIAGAAVYGEPDLIPTSRMSQEWQTRAQAVAVLVPKNFVIPSKTKAGTFDLLTEPLTSNWNLCSDQPLAHEPSFMVACSGFLVAPDLMLTAGHCMLNQGEVRQERTPYCEDFVWVFDFASDRKGRTRVSEIPAAHIVGCETVIHAKNDTGKNPQTGQFEYGSDFALVKLERRMQRPILPLVKQRAQAGEKLVLIGHPMGGPRVASRGVLLSDEGTHLRASVDAFEGNSGSPVLDMQGRVTGLLVRGYPDSVYTVEREGRRCDVINHCDETAQTCERSMGSGGEKFGEHIFPVPSGLYLEPESR